MRVSQEEKQKSRQRIIESAARLVRERGIEGTSVADVMQAAGMTHGGFYRHFQTKEEMLEAGISSAFGQMTRLKHQLHTQLGVKGGHEAFRRLYLSAEHLKGVGKGCPVAACAAEVARMDKSIRQPFAGGIEAMLATIAEAIPGSESEKRAAAIRELAVMVGAIVMARTCDGPTANEILEICLRGLHEDGRK